MELGHEHSARVVSWEISSNLLTKCFKFKCWAHNLVLKYTDTTKVYNLWQITYLRHIKCFPCKVSFTTSNFILSRCDQVLDCFFYIWSYVTQRCGYSIGIKTFQIFHVKSLASITSDLRSELAYDSDLNTYSGGNQDLTQ